MNIFLLLFFCFTPEQRLLQKTKSEQFFFVSETVENRNVRYMFCLVVNFFDFFECVCAALDRRNNKNCFYY